MNNYEFYTCIGYLIYLLFHVSICLGVGALLAKMVYGKTSSVPAVLVIMFLAGLTSALLSPSLATGEAAKIKAAQGSKQ